MERPERPRRHRTVCFRSGLRSTRTPHSDSNNLTEHDLDDSYNLRYRRSPIRVSNTNPYNNSFSDYIPRTSTATTSYEGNEQVSFSQDRYSGESDQYPYYFVQHPSTSQGTIDLSVPSTSRRVQTPASSSIRYSDGTYSSRPNEIRSAMRVTRMFPNRPTLIARRRLVREDSRSPPPTGSLSLTSENEDDPFLYLRGLIPSANNGTNRVAYADDKIPDHNGMFSNTSNEGNILPYMRRIMSPERRLPFSSHPQPRSPPLPPVMLQTPPSPEYMPFSPHTPISSPPASPVTSPPASPIASPPASPIASPPASPISTPPASPVFTEGTNIDVTDENRFTPTERLQFSCSESEDDSIEATLNDIIVLDTPEICIPVRSCTNKSMNSVVQETSIVAEASSISLGESSPDKSSHTNDLQKLNKLNQNLVSLLECPVCFDTMLPPIFQCIKGHLVCNSCRPKITMCPTCRSRFADRNLAMEKVAEKLMYPCKNSFLGCNEIFKLNDKLQHEGDCGFRLFECVLENCLWRGYKPELAVHMNSSHKDDFYSTGEKLITFSRDMKQRSWIFCFLEEVFVLSVSLNDQSKTFFGWMQLVGTTKDAEEFKYSLKFSRSSPFKTAEFSHVVQNYSCSPHMLNSQIPGITYYTDELRQFETLGSYKMNVKIEKFHCS